MFNNHSKKTKLLIQRSNAVKNTFKDIITSLTTLNQEIDLMVSTKEQEILLLKGDVKNLQETKIQNDKFNSKLNNFLND